MTAPVSKFSEDDFSGRAYAAILPRTGTDYAAQTADIAEQIQQHFNRATGKTVVRQTIFFRDPAQLDNIAALLTQAFSGSLPQTAFVAQAPADGSLIAAEITAAKNSEIEQRSANLTLEHRNGITWVHTHADALQGGKAPGSNSYADTLAVLQSNLAALQQGGATLAQVFRTWFYMGSIVAPDKRAPDGIQRYKELNRARTDAFGDTRFLAQYLKTPPAYDVYPASTGIGMGGQDVALSCSALITPRSDVAAVPLENPRQTPAFDYARHYSPETPKFARAMAIVYDGQADISISGTASITASETQHIGNVEKQTEETLLNITALISPENLARAGLAGYGATLQDLSVVRAYIKHPEDYAAVRRVCERQLNGIPVIYTIGDVCRDDLLVELEAAAHIRQA